MFSIKKSLAVLAVSAFVLPVYANQSVSKDVVSHQNTQQTTSTKAQASGNQALHLDKNAARSTANGKAASAQQATQTGAPAGQVGASTAANDGFASQAERFNNEDANNANNPSSAASKQNISENNDTRTVRKGS